MKILEIKVNENKDNVDYFFNQKSINISIKTLDVLIEIGGIFNKKKKNVTVSPTGLAKFTQNNQLVYAEYINKLTGEKFSIDLCEIFTNYCKVNCAERK